MAMPMEIDSGAAAAGVPRPPRTPRKAFRVSFSKQLAIVYVLEESEEERSWRLWVNFDFVAQNPARAEYIRRYRAAVLRLVRGGERFFLDDHDVRYLIRTFWKQMILGLGLAITIFS